MHTHIPEDYIYNHLTNGKVTLYVVYFRLSCTEHGYDWRLQQHECLLHRGTGCVGRVVIFMHLCYCDNVVLQEKVNNIYLMLCVSLDWQYG